MGNRSRRGALYILGLAALLSSLWVRLPGFFPPNRDDVISGDPGTFLIDEQVARVASIEDQQAMRERLLPAVENQVRACDAFPGRRPRWEIPP